MPEMNEDVWERTNRPDRFITGLINVIHGEGFYALDTEEQLDRFAGLANEKPSLWRRVKREVRAVVKKEISDLKVSVADDWAERIDKRAAKREVKQENPGGKVFELKSEVHISRHLERDITDDHDLVYDYGHFHKYDPSSGIWRPVPEHVLSRIVQEYDGAKVIKDPTRPTTLEISSSKADGAIRFFRDRVNRSAATEDENSFFDQAPTGLMFPNIFLRVDDDEIEPVEPSPEHRARIGVDVPYDPDADAPLFEQYLDSIFAGDDDADDKKRLLVEFFGASIFGVATRFKRTLVLADGTEGSDGDNGKSVIIKITSRLLPKSATSKVSPQQFDDRFATTQLVGSRINHVSELPEEDILASDKLKGVISGDPMFAEHKYGDNFWFEPSAGHVFAANDLPKVRATDNAFWKRWIVLPFNNRFTPKGEPGRDRIEDLDQRICEEEMAGVMAKLVEGARRVLARGSYEHPAESEERKTEWRTDSNPLRKFLIERCKYYKRDGQIREAGVKWWLNEDTRIGASAFYKAYKSWASKNGYGQPNKTTFGNRMKKLVDKRRSGDGVYYRATLKNASDLSRSGSQQNTSF